MSPAERILHDCPWCSAGDEPVPNSLHAAAWEVVNGWSDAELLMAQLRRLRQEEEGMYEEEMNERATSTWES
jgi:hypothetical protein